MNVAAEAAFDLSQDYARRLQWDPFLASAELLAATAPAVGVVARCRGHFGPAMDTKYVSFRRPSVAAVTLVRGPWLFESFSASWNFQERGPSTTEIRFIYAFALRPRALRAFFEPVAAAVFRFEMGRRLSALARQLELPAP